ncbi:MAG TPA: metalloregulator ArsR/SmtB family transcription factor [Conexivisphaerales archaeon]|nr:metalloregulator ArsR/SmtB family transcription factor [Conexivisphaerales archaeon]
MSQKNVNTNLYMDPVRLHILNLLSVSEMSMKELSEELRVSQPTVLHHMKQLIDGGLVKLSRSETKGNLIEKFYTTSYKSKGCECAYQVMGEATREERVQVGYADVGFMMSIIARGGSIWEKAMEGGTKPFYPVGTSVFVFPSEPSMIPQVNEILSDAEEKLRKLAIRNGEKKGSKFALAISAVPYL